MESTALDAEDADQPSASTAVQGGALRSLGYLVGLGTTVISAALVFRYLSTVQSGEYVEATALVAVVAAVSDLGLTSVGVRELSIRRGPGRWDLAQDLLGLRITITVLAGILASAGAWLWWSPQLGRGVALAMVGLLLLVTQDNILQTLIVTLRLRVVAVLELSRQVLTALVLTGLVVAGADLTWFLASSIVVGVVMLAAVTTIVRGTRPLLARFRPAQWRRLMAPIVAYTLAVAASALYLRAAVFVVSAICTGPQLGDFGLSYRVVTALADVPALLAGSLLPLLARHAESDRTALGRSLGGIHALAVLVGAWAAVSIAVGAPLAVEVIGGHNYPGSASILAVQGISLGFMFISTVWGNALVSLGLFRQILVINAGALVATIVLSAVFAALFGPVGAAAGVSAAEGLLATAEAAYLIRGPQRLAAWHGIPRAVWFAVPAGLVPLALVPLGVPTVVRLLLSVGLFGFFASRLALPPEAFALLPRALQDRMARPVPR